MGFSPGIKPAPQSVRTFHVSTSTAGKRPLLQTDRMASLMLDVLQQNRHAGHFNLHALAIMRNHLHLLLTAPAEVPVEKCVQYVKGGFSFRAKRELGFSAHVWTPGFNQTVITSREQYWKTVEYIHQNPVKVGMV